MVVKAEEAYEFEVGSASLPAGTYLFKLCLNQGEVVASVYTGGNQTRR
jgi:hypothetical protein